jgi:hypothetical protein
VSPLNTDMIDLNADGGFILVNKLIDENRVSTIVYANDTELFFPVDANSWYEFNVRFDMTGTAGLGGLGLSFQLPAGATANYTGRTSAAPGVSSGRVGMASVVTAAAMLANLSGSMFGDIRVNATSGLATFQWCQNVSDVNPITMKSGCFLLYRKIK